MYDTTIAGYDFEITGRTTDRRLGDTGYIATAYKYGNVGEMPLYKSLTHETAEDADKEVELHLLNEYAAPSWQEGLTDPYGWLGKGKNVVYSLDYADGTYTHPHLITIHVQEDGTYQIAFYVWDDMYKAYYVIRHETHETYASFMQGIALWDDIDLELQSWNVMPLGAFCNQFFPHGTCALQHTITL